eukprot:1142484-Pelagomonas_calceolata.AAC.2
MHKHSTASALYVAQAQYLSAPWLVVIAWGAQQAWARWLAGVGGARTCSKLGWFSKGCENPAGAVCLGAVCYTPSVRVPYEIGCGVMQLVSECHEIRCGVTQPVHTCTLGAVSHSQYHTSLILTSEDQCGCVLVSSKLKWLLRGSGYSSFMLYYILYMRQVRWPTVRQLKGSGEQACVCGFPFYLGQCWLYLARCCMMCDAHRAVGLDWKP